MNSKKHNEGTRAKNGPITGTGMPAAASGAGTGTGTQVLGTGASTSGDATLWI